MSRSLKKGPFVDEKLYRKVEKASGSTKRTAIKTWSRACTIVPEFVGFTFQVHNGRKFIDVYCTEDMVGHKLGEFSLTKTFKGHTNKKEGIAEGSKG
ncbi:MAG: ribosomal protein [Planctomycetota bacterium]|jgi:small subunit ribosomal protein S19